MEIREETMQSIKTHVETVVLIERDLNWALVIFIIFIVKIKRVL